MARATFVNYPHKFMNIKFPEVIGINTINIDLFDNVTSITIVSESLEYEVNAYVENNEIDLSGILYETGTYTIKVETESEGVYERDIEIEEIATKLIFNVLPFDFNLGRVDENDFPVYEDDELYRTFVTTDVIRIQFYEEEGYSLEEEGYSYTDIVWEVKGVTENDGTVNEQDSGWDFVYAFTPNPINRPLTRPVTVANEPIKYEVFATIYGLKKSFSLEQDQIDILRQEYIDFNTTFQPLRSNVYHDEGLWNVGNYDYIVSESNGNHFETIYDSLVRNWQAKGYNNRIEVSSAYRNPRRNPGVQNSLHLRGRALDVYPEGGVDLQKWLDLRASGNEITEIDGVEAHCDQSGTFVDDNCSIANHIHIQW